MEPALESLVGSLAKNLVARNEMLVTAESCTGGWVAKACTDLAGSSAWFDRGFVTYSNQSKQDMLGVSASTLDSRGAVSEQVVAEMVNGALAGSSAQWVVAISGITGPGGGSADKPVGTVWLAWGGPSGWRSAQRFRFQGDRDAVRRQAVMKALDVLLARCCEIS